MALTKDEWMRTAEYAAAAEWGKDHKGWFVFRRFGLPVLLVALPLGVIGFLGWRTWNAMAGAFSGHSAGVPTAFWVIGTVLVLSTAIAFRPRAIPASTHSLMLKAVALLVLWLGFIAYGIGMMVS